eukprot:CAMPEP_0170170274 /NCGR_PEP_ID=MMETSP0040_2-20121228/3239_1 /TAXON_ID=641309 /ORGANISM="Lotharella oceanica, Strain CCMP622" /LENGTH=298 /DNA_ID=CAMNT_0010409557 /DNA_START=32 /DNA_END=928 /DNA_ORIENTATION=-
MKPEEGKDNADSAPANVKVNRNKSLLALTNYDDDDESDAASDSDEGLNSGLLNYDFGEDNADESNRGDRPDSSSDVAGRKEEKYDIEKSKFRHLLELNLLPPEPTGPVDPMIQKAVEAGVNVTGKPSVNKSLRGLKSFHNPYILQKVAQEFKINTVGSNYPPHLFSPSDVPKEDFFDALKKRQKQHEADLNAKKNGGFAPAATPKPNVARMRSDPPSSRNTAANIQRARSTAAAISANIGTANFGAANFAANPLLAQMISIQNNNPMLQQAAAAAAALQRRQIIEQQLAQVKRQKTQK